MNFGVKIYFTFTILACVNLKAISMKTASQRHMYSNKKTTHIWFVKLNSSSILTFSKSDLGLHINIMNHSTIHGHHQFSQQHFHPNYKYYIF